MYFITGATIFSAFAFLGGPGWAYSKGAAAFYILGYGALGFVPFYFVGPRAARLGRAYGFVTQAEMVAERYGMRAIAGVMAFGSGVLISALSFELMDEAYAQAGMGATAFGFIAGAADQAAVFAGAGDFVEGPAAIGQFSGSSMD